MPASQTADEIYAEFYDASLEDWPGEIDFYRRLAAEKVPPGGSLLEIACGTGRITLRLSDLAAHVTGMDLDEPMLAIARSKAGKAPNVCFVQGDMRRFDLDERFALAIFPGHSFQFMLTPSDQLACLTAIHRHLQPGGALCIHVNHDDVAWLGRLCSGQGGVFGQPYELVHPDNGRRVRIRRAWSYAPATHTATAINEWEELDAASEVIARWQRGPTPLHCVTRCEMEHLVARAGFTLEAVYGDFFGNPFEDRSESMIWVLRAETPA